MGMRKKSDGTFCARITARGFQQRDGEHYDSQSISSPVASHTTIKVVTTLAVMMDWKPHVVEHELAVIAKAGDAADNGTFNDELKPLPPPKPLYRLSYNTGHVLLGHQGPRATSLLRNTLAWTFTVLRKTNARLAQSARPRNVPPH